MRGRTIKPWWVVAAFLSGLAFAMAAEELILSTQEESRLEFSAPRVHFLVGKPLERLRKRFGRAEAQCIYTGPSQSSIEVCQSLSVRCGEFIANRRAV